MTYVHSFIVILALAITGCHNDEEARNREPLGSLTRPGPTPQIQPASRPATIMTAASLVNDWPGFVSYVDTIRDGVTTEAELMRNLGAPFRRYSWRSPKLNKPADEPLRQLDVSIAKGVVAKHQVRTVTESVPDPIDIEIKHPGDPKVPDPIDVERRKREGAGKP